MHSFRPLRISSAYWGAEKIEKTDFNLSVDLIDNFDVPDIISSSPKLKLYLQNAINSGKDRFQTIIFFTGTATDNDDSADYWGY